MIRDLLGSLASGETRSGQMNISQLERVASLVGGGLLAGWGLSRRRQLSPLAVLGGVALMYRGATGHCGIYERLGLNTAECRQGSSARTSAEHPTIDRDPSGAPTRGRLPLDMVQVASEESFPASDPPSFNP